MSVPTSPALRVDKVSVHSGDRLRLAEVSLDVAEGEVVGLIGPNGSGKSTLMGVLSGEITPTSGAIALAGAPIYGMDSLTRARTRAVLGQDNPSIFSFTVREVVSWGRHCWRGRNEANDDATIIAESMAAFDVAGLADRVLTQLSGGERARVHLARVAAQQAPILLLDEADSHLDLVGRAHVDALINSHRGRGGTCIVISHDLPRLASVADRIVLLSGGSMLGVGKPAEIFTASWIARAYGLSEPEARRLLSGQIT
jgi:iron complex transport system ATP-binding protein